MLDSEKNWDSVMPKAAQIDSNVLMDGSLFLLRPVESVV
jgi:hypothetical protein